MTMLAVLLSVAVFANGNIASITHTNCTAYSVCDGTANGFVTAGGTGPFVFTWAGQGAYAATATNITALCAGTYTLTVTDISDGSYDTAQVIIVQPLPVATTTHTDINCNGYCNGTANGFITGGGGGSFSFSWTGPNNFTAATSAITNLCGGVYTLTVTDSSNMMTFIATANVIQPASQFQIIASSDTAFCGGGIATLDVAFSGNYVSQYCGLSTSGGCGGSAAVATIGTGLASNSGFSFPAPFANWYTSTSQQYLYTAAELNAAGITGGKIDQLDFDVTAFSAGGITTFHEYTIQMGGTNLTTFSAGNPVFETGLYTVFPASTVTITTGWNSFVFTNAFIWDGVSNIIVQVCNNEGPPFPNYTYNAHCAQTATTNTSCQYVLSDQSDQCSGITGFIASVAFHPDIRFYHCNSNPPIPSNFSYLWTASLGNIANDTLQNTTAMANQTTAYVITVTDNSTSCMKTDTVNVTITAPFTANFTMVPDSTNGFNYWAFNASIGNGYTYLWDFGDGNTSAAQSPTHTYATGNYTVCLTVSAGSCSNTMCQNITVTGALNTCMALFNVAQDTNSVNPNAYTVTDLSFGGNLTYSWNFGDSTFSAVQHPSHTYANIGPYQLCLTVDNGSGCVQTYCDSLFAVDSLHTHLQPITINVVDGPGFGTTVGINDVITNGDFIISPNPCSDKITIDGSLVRSFIGSTIKIQNILGEIVFETKIQTLKPEMDLSSFPKGIYFVDLQTKRGIVIKKLIKQ